MTARASINDDTSHTANPVSPHNKDKKLTQAEVARVCAFNTLKERTPWNPDSHVMWKQVKCWRMFHPLNSQFKDSSFRGSKLETLIACGHEIRID